MRKSAYIYCRISQDRTGAGLGVERQEQDCRKLAESLGMEVLAVFVDNDMSAFSGKKRPAYSDMMEKLAKGSAQAVLCWHTDRLHRSPRELESYIDICEKHGITTHATQAGEIDLATPSGRAVARTLGAWARYESEHKSERLTRAKRQAREQGKFTGGPIPYGWDIVDQRAVPNDEQAKAIKLAVGMLLGGQSIAAVIREFQSRGISTPRGGAKWNHATLYGQLLRPKLAGLMEVDGELVDDPGFPAILTEDEWLGVRAVLSDPTRRVSFDNRNRWLLSGIATCECGSTVKVGATKDHRGGRRAVYRCKVDGPGHVNRQAVQVDMVVEAIVEVLLSQPEASASAAAATSAPDSGLAAEANGLRARLSEAALMAADGDITMAQLRQITERLRSKLDELESAMANQSIAATQQTFDAASEWSEASLEKKRKLLSQLVDVRLLRVGRNAGRNFDPDSVEVTLKSQ
jgi:DNA invertase Pin-like site-specific DNA recombinase